MEKVSSEHNLKRQYSDSTGPLLNHAHAHAHAHAQWSPSETVLAHGILCSKRNVQLLNRPMALILPFSCFPYPFPPFFSNQTQPGVEALIKSELSPGSHAQPLLASLADSDFKLNIS